MQILRREWYDVSRADVWQLYPLGDVHLGSRKCDEDGFRATVDQIAAHPRALWLGMGDYAEFINVTDPRFDFGTLAPWVTTRDLCDLAAAQRDRFLSIVAPIAGKCIGLVRGNHEGTIHRKYERDIYAEIVGGVKVAAGMGPDERLGLGMTGWIVLSFYRSDQRERGTTITLSVHHGFTGGRLAGGKALNMQRWLWTHDCDLAVFGHSHNTSAQPEAVEAVAGDKVVRQVRRGAYSGTFLGLTEEGPDTYEEVKGYLPLPLMQPLILLRPGAEEQSGRVKIVV